MILLAWCAAICLAFTACSIGRPQRPGASRRIVQAIRRAYLAIVGRSPGTTTEEAIREEARWLRRDQ